MKKTWTQKQKNPTEKNNAYKKIREWQKPKPFKCI